LNLNRKLAYDRVSPDIDGIEVLSDNTLDRNRSQEWTYQRYTIRELRTRH